jgi:hypothetical protein
VLATVVGVLIEVSMLPSVNPALFVSPMQPSCADEVL